MRTRRFSRGSIARPDARLHPDVVVVPTVDDIARGRGLAALEELGRTWVVEIDGEIAAFATGYRGGSNWALLVHPDHEDCGYGKTLHSIVVSWLWSPGLKRIGLATAPGTRAELFYLSQGWQPCGTVPGGDIRHELCGP